MYPLIPALDDKEVRSIHSDVIPAVAGGFVALDFELRHSPVAVVVDFQSKLFHLREG